MAELRERKGRPGPIRLVVVLCGVTASLGALAAVAAASPRSIAGSALALVCGMAVAVLFHSVWEWAFHRYLYHRVLAPVLKPIYLTHHVDHHVRDYPASRFTGEVVHDHAHEAHGSVWLRVVRRFIPGMPAIPDRWVYLAVGLAAVATPAWWLTHNVFFCAGIAVAGATLASLFGKVHGAIHQPGAHPLIEAQPWFGFLARHHYIHHVDFEANMNFLIPIADWLCGTLRRHTGRV